MRQNGPFSGSGRRRLVFPSRVKCLCAKSGHSVTAVNNVVIRSPRRRVASDLGDHIVEPAWAKRGRRGGKDELAHRQRVIVFDLRRKVPVAVEFPRKGLAANQFSGERFTRWSSVTASSFPFPSRTVEWLIYHSTVHRF